MLSTLGQETLVSGKYLELKKLHLEGGKTYEMVSRTGNKHAVAGLVRHRENETFIFIEQYRYPVQQRVLELVAGLMDKDLTPEATLSQEIAEETGYHTIEKIEFLAHTTASAGALSETTALYHVEISGEKGLQELGELEDIEILEIKIKDLQDFLQGKRASGILIDSKVFMAVYLFLQKTGKII